MNINAFFKWVGLFGVLTVIPVFAVGDSGGNAPDLLARYKVGSCAESGQSTQTQISEDDGGTVQPTGSAPFPAGNGVIRSNGGQGLDTVSYSQSMLLPVTPGKEYTANWSGGNTRSAHTIFEPEYLPEGYTVEKNDGNGWTKGNVSNHMAPAGQLLDLPNLTTKFRVVRNITPAGKGFPIELTRPKFKYQPSLYGVTSVDANGDGLPDVEIPRAYTMISLGATTEGGRSISAGHLILDKELWTTTGFVVDTSMLSYEGVSNPNVEVVTTGASQTVRQILAPDLIIDVVTINATSFEIRLYPPSAKGTANANGIYSLTGVMLSKCTVSRLGSAGNYGYGMRIQQFMANTLTRQIDLRARQIGATTFETTKIDGAETEVLTNNVLPFGNGAATESILIAGQGVIFGNNSFHRIQTIETKRDNIVVSHQVTRFPFTSSGEFMLDRIDKFGHGNNETVATQYYNHSLSGSAPTGSFGKPIFKYLEDGSWERYEYNENGYVTKILRPWKGIPATPWSANDTNCQLELTEYTTDPFNPVPNDAPAEVGTHMSPFVGKVERRILGQTVERTLFEYQALTVNNEKVLRKTIRRYMRSTPQVQLQDSVEEMYHPSASMAVRNKMKSETFANGRQNNLTYESGIWNATINTFTPSATGRDVREVITHGTNTNPEGIANKTVREVIIRNANGQPLKEETQIYTGNNTYETATVTLHRYDEFSRFIESKKDGRIVASSTYNALSTTTVDESGIERTITRDLNGRITSDAKAGGKTTTALYQGTQVTRTTGTLTSSATVDLLGRTTSITATDGEVTQYTYPNKGKDKLAIYAGGMSVLTTNYPGGTVQSITNSAGNSIIPTYYEYGVNADGTQWTKTSIGSASSPRWTKQTEDWTGNAILQESPAASNTGTVTRTSTYNDFGQLVKTSMSANTGLADLVYEYNELGDVYRKGVDINGDGLVTSSADRISEFEYGYIKNASNNHWYQQRILSEYLNDNNALKTTIESTQVRLHGNLNGEAGHVINTDAAGVTVEVTETFDPATKKRTLTTTHSDQTGTGTRTYTNGLLTEEKNSWDTQSSSYQYDALERLTVRTSRRNASTSTRAYNAQNQLQSVTDHEGNVTQFFYYPATHVNAGQLKEVRNAQGKSVYSEYNNRGEETRNWGAATNPTERVYNSYGELITLKTYRTGSGWTTSTWPSGTAGVADATTWVYEEATGLLKEKQDAAGKKVTYTWKDNGKLHTRTWARGTVTTYGYDSKALETNITYSNEPAGITTPSVFITRDRTGRLNTVTDGSGTRSYTYTPSDQIDTVNYGANGILANYAIDYGFDIHSRQSSFQIKHNSSTLYQNAWQYDGVTGRVASVLSDNHKATYTRHQNSSLIRQIELSKDNQPLLYNTKGYNALGRLATNAYYIKGQSSVNRVSLQSYQYDTLGRKTKVRNQDATYWEYVYNDKSELISGQKYLAGGNRFEGKQYHFSYDNAGNRTAKQTGGDMAGANLRTFATPSNNLNQYSAFNSPNSFDVIGTTSINDTVIVNGINATRQAEYFRHSVTASNANSNGAWVNVNITNGDATQNGHVYIPPANFTPTYDLDGNLTSDGEWSYSYDAENRLIKAERTQAAQNAGAPYRRIEYAYDSMHRRIQALYYHGSTSPPATTEKYLYDNRNRCLTTNASNQAVQSFTWGLDALGSMHGAGGGLGGLLWLKDHTSAETHFACTDGNSNIVNLVSSNTQSITATYEYSPFGELIRSTGYYAKLNPYRFSSKPQDAETGLYDYGFRSYKASWGVWLGRDPLGEIGGVNLYGFVNNNPANNYDILGGSFLGYNSWGEYGREVWDNIKNFGKGIYEGAKDFVQGLKDLPEVAKFLASREFFEILRDLIIDKDFRAAVAEELGSNICSFVNKLGSDAEFAFKNLGKTAFGLISGTGGLKIVNALKKIKKLKNAGKLPREKPEFNATFDNPADNTFSSGGQGQKIDVDFTSKKRSQVQENKAAGDAARDKIAAETGGEIEKNFRVTGGLRRVDVVSEETIIESKVGRTSLDKRVRQELARDVKILRSGQAEKAEWRFSRSDVTGKGGPTAPLRNKLEKFGIDIVE